MGLDAVKQAIEQYWYSLYNFDEEYNDGMANTGGTGSGFDESEIVDAVVEILEAMGIPGKTKKILRRCKVRVKKVFRSIATVFKSVTAPKPSMIIKVPWTDARPRKLA